MRCVKFLYARKILSYFLFVCRLLRSWDSGRESELMRVSLCIILSTLNATKSMLWTCSLVLLEPTFPSLIILIIYVSRWIFHQLYWNLLVYVSYLWGRKRENWRWSSCYRFDFLMVPCSSYKRGGRLFHTHPCSGMAWNPMSLEFYACYMVILKRTEPV